MTLHVALIEPQIPPNTGNIARLCAATGSSLHLIEPLGFALGDPTLKRAGLDYWQDVDLWVHGGWRAFRSAISRDRCLYFSSWGRTPYWEAKYRPGMCLVFGNETHGMPERIREKHREAMYRIPMTGAVRSLNLASAVAIVLYEALRQLGEDFDAPASRRRRSNPSRP